MEKIMAKNEETIEFCLKCKNATFYTTRKVLVATLEHVHRHTLTSDVFAWIYLATVNREQLLILTISITNS